MLKPDSFLETERAIMELLIVVVSKTDFGKYYPNADVVIRWRHGKVLPVVEVNRKMNVDVSQPIWSGE